jgi:hypothetical protein
MPFKTELINNDFRCCFRLRAPGGTVVEEIWTEEPYEANAINDAFAKFAELAKVPFEKAESLYVHPYPPDGP